jgi:hypothetical protein
MTRITLRKEVRALVLCGAGVGYMLALTIVIAVEGFWWQAAALGLCSLVAALAIESDLRMHFVARIEWNEAASPSPRGGPSE